MLAVMARHPQYDRQACCGAMLATAWTGDATAAECPSSPVSCSVFRRGGCHTMEAIDLRDFSYVHLMVTTSAPALASSQAHRSAACRRSAITLAMIACGGGDAAGPLAVLRGRCIAASTFSACSCSSFAARACASGVAASRACEPRQLSECTQKAAMRTSREPCDRKRRDRANDRCHTAVRAQQVHRRGAQGQPNKHRRRFSIQLLAPHSLLTSRTRTAAMDAGTEVLAAALATCASASIARCTASQLSCCCFLYGGAVFQLLVKTQYGKGCSFCF